MHFNRAALRSWVYVMHTTHSCPVYSHRRELGTQSGRRLWAKRACALPLLPSILTPVRARDAMMELCVCRCVTRNGGRVHIRKHVSNLCKFSNIAAGVRTGPECRVDKFRCDICAHALDGSSRLNRSIRFIIWCMLYPCLIGLTVNGAAAAAAPLDSHYHCITITQTATHLVKMFVWHKLYVYICNYTHYAHDIEHAMLCQVGQACRLHICNVNNWESNVPHFLMAAINRKRETYKKNIHT